jgi:hypothetical protein
MAYAMEFQEKAVAFCTWRVNAVLARHQSTGSNGSAKDLGIDVPGHLRLTGASLELRATDGSTEIEARDDVIVQAETIHLN